MNSRQLLVFREVMLTGSLSEAARNLGRTQPAISNTIAGIEEELGYKLFVRRSGRLLPVPEAHYLLEEASEILDRLRTVRQNMTSLGKLEQGELRILSMPGPSVILLPRLVAQFVRNHPDIRVALLTRSSAQVQHLVAAQRSDIGLADHEPQADEIANLIEQETITYDCVCAVPAADPLADKRVITPEDLAQRAMAALFPGHLTHQGAAAAFQACGVPFRPRFETQYFYPLLSFVEAGLACAIVDPLSAESYRLSRQQSGRITFRPFTPTVPFPVAIVKPRHRPLSMLSLAFIDALRAELLRQQDNYRKLH